MTPLVSCIMPTKNRRRFVERSIQMWLDQRFRREDSCPTDGVELIVLEDGEECCADLIHNWWDRMRYVRYSGTLGAKLNEGARLARGKYLVNWDDDDYQCPDRIANTVKLFELTGAQMLAMSSMLYYREGDPHGWEYDANSALYGTGSGHAFTREWALANPHPDITVAEDEAVVAEAKRQGALVTIGGTQWVIACTHGAHCSPRHNPGESEMEKLFGIADNWRQVPLSDFEWVQRWTLSQVPA